MKQKIKLNGKLPKIEITFRSELLQSKINAIINSYGDIMNQDSWFFGTVIIIQETMDIKEKMVNEFLRL